MQSHRQMVSCVIKGVFKGSVAWYKLESIFLASAVKTDHYSDLFKFCHMSVFCDFLLIFAHHFSFSLFPPALNILSPLPFFSHFSFYYALQCCLFFPEIFLFLSLQKCIYLCNLTVMFCRIQESFAHHSSELSDSFHLQVENAREIKTRSISIFSFDLFLVFFVSVPNMDRYSKSKFYSSTPLSHHN